LKRERSATKSSKKRRKRSIGERLRKRGANNGGYQRHQNDVKEFNTDTKSFIEKYHQFTNQIKELIYAK
jgi:hypothetical protein